MSKRRTRIEFQGFKTWRGLLRAVDNLAKEIKQREVEGEDYKDENYAVINKELRAEGKKDG